MKYFFVIIVILSSNCFPQSGTQKTIDSINQIYKDREKWVKDVDRICDSAYAYRFRLRANGGGQGSYIGFTIPKNYDSTDLGTYRIIEIFPEKIIIQANNHVNKFPMFCTVDSNGDCRSRINATEYEVNKIGQLAYQYRVKPISEGGGGGSYAGFRIPDGCEQTAFGKYAIFKVKHNEISVQVNYPNERISRIVIFNPEGTRKAPVGFQTNLDKIMDVACQYRSRPVSEGGGGGSYIGFKIPDALAAESNWKFSLGNVWQDEMVINVSSQNPRINTHCIIDSTGKRKQPEFVQRGNYDEFIRNNNAIVFDVEIISKEAVQYWKKSKPLGTMRGSFEGFTIPISKAFTNNGTYSIVEMKEDTIYVRAVSAIGLGKEYFMLDYNGKVKCLADEEYRPPVSRLMSNAEDPLAMYKNADWKLNEVYQQLLALKKSDSGFIKNLREAERLWIEYRDARLKEKYPKINPSSDKSMFTKPQLIYLTILTEDRIKELQEMLDQP